MRLLAIILSRIYFGLFYRVELVNMENVPEKGPAILCANHNGILDMFFIGYKLKRWVHWMGKEELFRNPILAAIFTALGSFPVKRGKGDVGSIKKVYKLLNDGHIMGIFPQGTRVDLQKRKAVKIKSGAAMLAVNSGALIIPVAIKGNFKLFSRVKVIYGVPFKPEAEEGRKHTSEELSQISNNIMDRIISLMEE